jgi:hypothetical protein
MTAVGMPEPFLIRILLIDSSIASLAQLNTPSLCYFPHFTLSAMRNRSMKSRMTRVPSDDENEVVKVPSTRYQLLPNGNFMSSSQAVHVATSNPKISQNLADNVVPEDAQVDHSPPQLDPAFLEHLNEEFVTVRHPRSHVSALNFLTLTAPAKRAHPDEPSQKMASGTRFISC